MKISLNWIRDFVTIDRSPADVAELLTMTGLEVDGIIPIGGSLDGVVVGRVLETRPHPNADRLTLCRVDAGGDEPLSIVCGAPNVAAGQTVAVATAGATLNVPDRSNPGVRVPLTIRKAKIRGEASEGMICAEDELGLGDDHAGILVLTGDAKPGTAFESYLASTGVPANDHVFDVSITPNRPDATSHVGVARDIAARTDTPLRLPAVEVPAAQGDVPDQVSIRIDTPDGCPRFAAMVVRNVTIAESPAWLQARLRAVGLRPRNNVVDVTNYVMLELGQPLHAYDLDNIAGASIVVRETTAEAEFVTLDEKRRMIPAGTIMVCDGDGGREIGIAGIMGGMNTEVTDSTTNVLIEGAYWNPAKIRATSKALGLQTDASYRFERGVDSDGQAVAVARAAQLITELGGGVLVPGILDVVAREMPARKTTLRLGQIERHLGRRVPETDVVRLLGAAGFLVTRADDSTLECTIPTFRPDVEREIDVIEEVARLFGYENFDVPEATRIPNFTPRERASEAVLSRIHGVLTGCGFREICTNSLISESVAARFNDASVSTLSGSPVVTANAITSEMTTLRPSLLAGALPVLQYNTNRGQAIVRLFEVGNIFAKTSGRNSAGSDSGDRDSGGRDSGGRDSGGHDSGGHDSGGLIPGYSEHTSLLLLAAGPRGHRAFDEAPRESDYFDLKGAVQSIAEHLRTTFTFAPIADGRSPLIEYGETVSAHDGTDLGAVARLAPEVARAYDADSPVCFAELNFTRLVAAYPTADPAYAPVGRFPIVDRDIAVVLNEGEPAGEVLATVRASGGSLLLSADVFDVYRGQGIENGKKSVAIAMQFGADRTLTDTEVDAAVASVVSALRKRHDGELRA